MVRDPDVQMARVNIKVAGINLRAGKITLHDFLVRVNKEIDQAYNRGYLDGQESDLVTEGK